MYEQRDSFRVLYNEKNSHNKPHWSQAKIEH